VDKALSIRQPWAWAIVEDFKDVENRSWSGRLGIFNVELAGSDQRAHNR
jgi:hypothetical protein